MGTTNSYTAPKATNSSTTSRHRSITLRYEGISICVTGVCVKRLRVWAQFNGTRNKEFVSQPAAWRKRKKNSAVVQQFIECILENCFSFYSSISAVKVFQYRLNLNFFYGAVCICCVRCGKNSALARWKTPRDRRQANWLYGLLKRQNETIRSWGLLPQSRFIRMRTYFVGTFSDFKLLLHLKKEISSDGGITEQWEPSFECDKKLFFVLLIKILIFAATSELSSFQWIWANAVSTIVESFSCGIPWCKIPTEGGATNCATAFSFITLTSWYLEFKYLCQLPYISAWIFFLLLRLADWPAVGHLMSYSIISLLHAWKSLY